MMNVTVESPTELERRMRVEVPESRVAGEVNKRLKSMTQTVRLAGFRPGKVPIGVVTRQFGSQVRQEVVGELVRTSFYDALVKEELKPAGAPVIDPVDSAPGEGVAYTAVFEVYPQVEAPVVEELTIACPVAKVTDEDVDRMLDTLRRQRRTWERVDRPAETGDRVVIDFEGTVDGEPVQGASGKEVPLELGGGSTIEGFEDGLVGVQAGDERVLNLTFPDPYHAAELAGKPVRFEVRVHHAEQALLPDLDEEFALLLGVKEGGMEALRREVRGNMERELRDGLRARTRERVMDALLASHPVTLPKSLVDGEIRSMIEEQGKMFARQGVDPKKLNLEPALFEEAARQRVSLALLVGELVKAHDLRPEPTKVRERIESIASTYEEPDQVVSWYYAEKERLSDIEASVLEERVVEWVLERAQVTEESLSFDELLKRGQTTPQAA